MNTSRTIAHVAALLSCAALLAIAAAAPAPATTAADGRAMTSGPLAILDAGADCPRNAGIEATGRDGVTSPTGGLGENGSEGDNDVPNRDNGANGPAGPTGERQCPTADNDKPGANDDGGHARAPPAVLSARRTDPGA